MVCVALTGPEGQPAYHASEVKRGKLPLSCLREPENILHRLSFGNTGGGCSCSWFLSLLNDASSVTYCYVVSDCKMVILSYSLTLGVM